MYIDFVEPKLEEIAHYRAMGATKEELASYLGVTKDTFRKLSNKFPELSRALVLEKKSLVMRLEKVVIEKALAGDNSCLFKVLSVLEPDKWGEKRAIDTAPSITIVNDLDLLKNKVQERLPEVIINNE